MAELADALASGASVGNDVQVQLLFRALAKQNALLLFGRANLFCTCHRKWFSLLFTSNVLGSGLALPLPVGVPGT